MGSMSSFITSTVANQMPRQSYLPASYPGQYSTMPLPTTSYGYMPMTGSSAGYYGSNPQPLFGSPYSSGYQSNFYNPYAGGNYYQPQPQPMPTVGGKAPPTTMPVTSLPGPYVGELTTTSAAPGLVQQPTTAAPGSKSLPIA